MSKNDEIGTRVDAMGDSKALATAPADRGVVSGDYEVVTRGNDPNPVYQFPKWDVVKQLPVGAWFVTCEWQDWAGGRGLCSNEIRERNEAGDRMVVKSPWLGPDAANDLRDLVREHNSHADLLAALKELRAEHFRNLCDLQSCGCPASTLAASVDAAIAKAEG